MATRLAGRSGTAMGSQLRLTAPADRIEQAWEIVAAVFASTERALTRFDPSSSLSTLNAPAGTGSMQPIPRILGRALATAHRAYAMTHGNFDPRIVGALETAGEHAGVPLPPSPARLHPDERWLWLEHHPLRARISAPVDLGGIGKGLALRWAAAAVRSLGVDSFLIVAGGDVVAGAAPSNRGQTSLVVDVRR